MFATKKAAKARLRGLAPVRQLPVLAVDTRFNELQNRFPLKRKDFGKGLPDEPQPNGFVHKGALRAAPTSNLNSLVASKARAVFRLGI